MTSPAAMLKTSLALLSLLFLGSSAQEGCLNRKAEIAFLVDVSDSVGEANFQRVRDFMSEFAQGFTVSQEDTRFMVASIARITRYHLFLNGARNQTELADEIQDISYISGDVTFTGGGMLSVIGTAFLDDSDSDEAPRPDTPRFLIVIVNGDDGDATLSGMQYSVSLAVNNNISIFAIGIGADVTRSQLKRIVSREPGHDIFLKFYRELSGKVEELTRKICEEIPLPTDLAPPMEPSASHACEADMMKSYLCGKSVSCNCSLTSGESSGYIATWFKGGADTGSDVLTLTYNPNDPEVEYTCEAVSGSDRTFGSSLKITTENPCNPSPPQGAPPQMMGLY